MSVWTKVKTKVLEEKVNMTLFEEAMKDLELTLDRSVTQIDNYYGEGKVDAMLRYQGNKTALGIVVNEKGGIELVGDTYRSGIVRDKQHDVLVNMMAQAYQAHKLKVELENAGWQVTTKKVNDTIKLQCIEY